jgi:hypothetical protein
MKNNLQEKIAVVFDRRIFTTLFIKSVESFDQLVDYLN